GYYGYIGRSEDGLTFTASDAGLAVEWYTAAASHGTTWVVVGEGGTVLRSTDDGRTFSPVTSPTREDLYAVAFADDQIGLAVGAHGAAILTVDGGVSWRDASSGLDEYLGAVVFLGTTAVVAGEHGTMLGYPLVFPDLARPARRA